MNPKEQDSESHSQGSDNNLNKAIRNKNAFTEITRSVLMMDVKSPKPNTADGVIQRTSSILDEWMK